MNILIKEMKMKFYYYIILNERNQCLNVKKNEERDKYSFYINKIYILNYIKYVIIKNIINKYFLKINYILFCGRKSYFNF